MKALVFEGPGQLVPKLIAPPNQPVADQVLLRPTAVGLCFSDKHLFDGLYELGPDVLDIWDFEGPSPPVLGHELGGVVETVGPEVETVKPGDRVAVMPYAACGSCQMCRAGHPTLCSNCGPVPGGLAELCLVQESQCYIIPDTVSDTAAALVEPFACATRVARLGYLSPGQDVVIFGAEDFNLGQLQWARIAGAAARIVVDPSKVRREAAERCGATAVINPLTDDASTVIREALPFGADIVFVSTEDYIPSSKDYLAHAYKSARHRGLVAVNRTYGNQPWADADHLVPLIKELTIQFFGLFFSSEPDLGGKARDDYQLTIDYFAAGRLEADALKPEIVDFWSLETVDDAKRLYARLPDEAVKIICRIDGRAS